MKNLITTLIAITLLATTTQAQLTGCGNCNKDGKKWCFYNIGNTVISVQEPCEYTPPSVSFSESPLKLNPEMLTAGLNTVVMPISKERCGAMTGTGNTVYIGNHVYQEYVQTCWDDDPSHEDMVLFYPKYSYALLD